MPTNILMPALSPTMEKGNLAKWLKKVGDKIKSGDVIAEIETDKATMEVEAVDEGVLARIVVPEGTADVPVNQLIAVLAGEGEDVTAVAAPSAEKPVAAMPAAVSAPAASAAPIAVAAAPSAPVATGAAMAATGARVFASPLARRIAKDAGLSLVGLAGSGPHGRIVERDVRAAMASGTARPASAAVAPAPAKAVSSLPPDEQIKKFFEPGSYDEIPHDNMRRTIARRLTESMQNVPHFYLTADCDLDLLLSLREEANAGAPLRDGKPLFKLSVNDFVIKAMAMALHAIPDANVSFTEGAMLKHKRADVGVAVAIPNGLITPIVRDAGRKSLSAISLDMKDFAARAKIRKLLPTEYQGGTTAISNLGMFGIKQFTAVINPPHATILAVGVGEKRAVVRNGQLTAASVMSVTLSCDHRAVDGALGAELLQAFKGFIERPMSMLV
ncbi:pyruvate dehydrogenase complex dihydrolipoamide acetyltransferase [Candidatus Raskinella chloraquaticus]|jgi:pyruvate dehydrogenase E2 component (dihydrolipoamide acetyltransferase)|uniref:Acetyltransferase component of pyruvate dehydrogenase complex n=1 Tax=Candidatus Raskinella chloraquaticus TaxID=1951219 RepID=A0A1W9I0E9_9HYPH|nr:MAG: pyruvate dehydrogenase complex dihydrolipoamide acetyltransferase [Proteobacteria bacterium SG_bin8]